VYACTLEGLPTSGVMRDHLMRLADKAAKRSFGVYQCAGHDAASIAAAVRKRTFARAATPLGAIEPLLPPPPTALGAPAPWPCLGRLGLPCAPLNVRPRDGPGPKETRANLTCPVKVEDAHAKAFAAALFTNYRFINLTGGEIIDLLHASCNETLVMTQI
jgi:hypothetical protein